MKKPKLTLKKLMLLVLMAALAVWWFKDVQVTYLSSVPYKTLSIGGNVFATTLTLGPKHPKVSIETEWLETRHFDDFKNDADYIYYHAIKYSLAQDGLYSVHHNILKVEIF